MADEEKLINYQYIDNINLGIEGITAYADNVCAGIDKKVQIMPTKAQEIVDAKIQEINDNINSYANQIRDEIVGVFREQYQSALKKIKPIEPLVGVSVSLDNVVEIVTAIVEVIAKPYQPIIEFTTEILPRVIALSDNLQALITYQPSLNIPEGVTVPSLNIQIEPITIEEITGDGGAQQ